MINDEEDSPFPVVDQADDRAGEALGVPSHDQRLALEPKLRRTWVSDFAAVSSAHPISASFALALTFRVGKLSRIQRCTSASRSS